MLLATISLLAVQVGAASHDLETVLRRALPAPERLAAEVVLTAAARELARSRGLALGGPRLALAAGPRRTPDGDDSDLALDIDLPLARDHSPRRVAAAAYEHARRELPAAAEVMATLALELAYVDAWEAGAALALVQRDLAAAESWHAAVAARVDAGAEAPYETTLVAAEVAHARLALAAARERWRTSWVALAARAEVPANPEPLREPSDAVGRARARRSAEPVVERAVQARAELDRSLVALDAARDASRWSLGASLAREGDEDTTRLGLGYRVPLAGQTTARAAAQRAAFAERQRRAELELGELRGRLAGARERAAGLAAGTRLAADEVERALAALDARLAAGRDRPSQVLPLRRQLVGALATILSARAAHLRAAFEIEALTTETSP